MYVSSELGSEESLHLPCAAFLDLRMTYTQDSLWRIREQEDMSKPTELKNATTSTTAAVLDADCRLMHGDSPGPNHPV